METRNNSSRQHTRVKKPLKRRRGACEGCRPKKVRCDGGRPCSACQKSGEECRYVSTLKPWNHTARSLNRSFDNSDEETIVCGPAPETTYREDHGPQPIAAPIITPSSSTPLWVSGAYTQSPGRKSPTPRANVVTNPGTYHGQQTPMLSPQDTHHQDWNTLFPAGSFDLSQFVMTAPVQKTASMDDSGQVVPDSATDGTTISLNTPSDLLSIHPDFNHHMELDHHLDFSAPCPQLDLLQFEQCTSQLDHLSSDVGPDNPLSALDFSTGSVFLMDFVNSPLDRRMQSEISETLKSLAPRQTMYQQPDMPDDIDAPAVLHHSEYTDEYITACYEEPIGVGTFLTKQHVNDAIQGTRHAKENAIGAQKVAACLINSVLALGAHILSTRSPRDSCSIHQSNSQAYFSTASILRGGLMYVEDSLLKFHALLTMASFSRRMNYQLTAGLLAQATQCAQSLRLNSERAVKARWHNTSELESRAKRAFWYLYSMEKTFCLTQGIFSFIDDGNIQYPSPCPIKGHRGLHDVDWLYVMVLYAQAASAIANELYHTKSPLRSVEQFDRTINRLRGKLEAWKEALPPAYRKYIDTDGHQGTLGEPTEHSLQIYLLYQYHHALFAMYGPISRLPVDSTGLETFRQCIYRCEKTCLASARVVLFISSNLTLAATLMDRHLLHLPLIAISTIFRAVLRSPQSGRKDLSYLGLACGILGKLSLEIDVPLEQVLELSRHARVVVAEKSDKPDRPGAARRLSANEFN